MFMVVLSKVPPFTRAGSGEVGSGSVLLSFLVDLLDN